MNQPYADLEIHILGLQEQGYAVDLTLDGQREFARGFLDPTFLPWVPSASPEADGERLFAWLFADEPLKLAWAKASGVDTQCRIRLRIDDSVPELHILPWELLRQPATTRAAALQLSADSKTPFSRYLALTTAPGRLAVVERLKVLMAIADAKNLPQYDDLAAIDREEELTTLQEATADLKVDLTLLEGPSTLAAIEEALRQGYHVLHLVAHGTFRDQTGATLYLADDDNKVHLAGANALADMLGRQVTKESLLRLVFLASCQTATSSPSDAFRGLAPQLLRAGLPAVLAMQDLVPIPTAHKFAQAFYRQLLRHGLVDLAVNEARASVLTAQLPGAAIPVLFMRVPDGRLFVVPGVDMDVQAPGQSPYKGLYPFDEVDAPDFFGREALTAHLVGYLRDHSLLAVVGASGSGKSSLVQAGMVAALKEGQPLADGTLLPAGFDPRMVYIITPKAQPLESLAERLTRGSESVTATATLMDDLSRDPRSLRIYARRLLSQPGAGSRLLLVVDQFEELFTLCKDKTQRKAFVDALLAAACPQESGACSPDESVVTVVLTLRADFYANCAEFENLRAALESYQRYIGAMSQEELRRAIEGPAQRGGWELEPGLVDVLLQDVGGEPGALPLLSHALLETWKRRRGRTMTLAGYAASGRVQGAIAKTADDVYGQSLTVEQQAIARNIFLRLTELGEGAQDTRRRVSLSELVPRDERQEEVDLVLRKLADARLVTTYEDEAEVAHEALIREWPALRGWLEQDREALRVQRRLGEAAHEWETNDRDESYLYRGAQLVQAEELGRSYGEKLSQLEAAFLVASVALRDRQEREREAQRQQMLQLAQEREAEALRAAEAAQEAVAAAELAARTEREAAERVSRRNQLLLVAGALVLVAAVIAGLLAVQASGDRTAAIEEANARATAVVEAEGARATAVLEADARATAVVEVDAQAELAQGRLGAAITLLEDQLNFLDQAVTTESLAAQREQLQQSVLELFGGTLPTATLPDLTGQRESGARQALAEACEPQPCLRPRVYWEMNDEVEGGLVLQTEPPAGEEVSWGSTVTVTVSQGPPLVIETPIRMELIPVPTGEFVMGSDALRDLDAFDDEFEQHLVTVGDFYIGKYEVTNAQYAAFVDASGHEAPDHWVNGSVPAGLEDHPVVYVSWEDAVAFADWLSEETGMAFRLPTEAEWEKACRGTDGRIYPWGDNFDANKANVWESGIRDTIPVGSYSVEGGDSPYGVGDMAGNVWEWVADWYQEDYYKNSPAENPPGPDSGSSRVLRGASFNDSERGARCAYRVYFNPVNRIDNNGFRVGFSPA